MEFLLGAIILIILVYGLYYPTLKLSQLGLLVVIAGACLLYGPVTYVGLFKLLVILGGLAILLMLEGTPHHRSSPPLILLVILGNLLLVSSTNLISLYLALEMQTLCMFILVAYNKNSLKAAEAGLKYFVLGALSSGLFLFGCALIYRSIGGVEITLIMSSSFSYSLSAGFLLVTVALLFKVSAAPFHVWAPDVYGGAATWVAALLSVLPKLGVLFVIVQLELYNKALFIAALLSIIVGAIGALNQTRIKRLLAYSSIGHMGFILLGLAIGDIVSIQASIVYMVAYILTQILLWSIILTTALDKDSIIELGAIYRVTPILGLTLAVGLLSAAGIPPLAGFLTKWYIVVAAINQGYYVSALIALAFSVVSGVYYLRIIKIIFYQPRSSLFTITKVLRGDYPKVNLSKALLMGGSLYIIITVILCPNTLLQLVHLVII